MKIYFENNSGELEEISVDKLRDLVIDEGYLLELWDVDTEGNLYFQENTYGEYA